MKSFNLDSTGLSHNDRVITKNSKEASRRIFQGVQIAQLVQRTEQNSKLGAGNAEVRRRLRSFLR